MPIWHDQSTESESLCPTGFQCSIGMSLLCEGQPVDLGDPITLCSKEGSVGRCFRCPTQAGIPVSPIPMADPCPDDYECSRTESYSDTALCAPWETVRLTDPIIDCSEGNNGGRCFRCEPSLVSPPGQDLCGDTICTANENLVYCVDPPATGPVLGFEYGCFKSCPADCGNDNGGNDGNDDMRCLDTNGTADTDFMCEFVSDEDDSPTLCPPGSYADFDLGSHSCMENGTQGLCYLCRTY